MKTHLEYSPGRLQFTGLTAGAYGGVVEGSIAVELGEPGRVELDLAGRGLDSRALLAVANLPLPLESSVDCGVELSGETGDLNTWSGGGSFDAEARSTGDGQVPTSGSGTSGRDLDSAAATRASAASRRASRASRRATVETASDARTSRTVSRGARRARDVEGATGMSPDPSRRAM